MASKQGRQIDRGPRQLEAPKGPIAIKYDTFRLLGEPGWPQRYQEIWAMGAVSTAKTNGLCDACIISAEDYPGARLLVIRDTMENARLSVWDTLKRRASELIDSDQWRVVEHLNMIRCSNGSEIHVFGADTADNKLWGQEWFRAFCDQGEQLREEFIKTLHTRMRQQVYHKTTKELGHTHIKLTANWTGGRNWIYDRVVKKGTEVTEDFWDMRYTSRFKFQGKDEVVDAFVCMIISRTEENESNTIGYMKHIVLAGEIGDLATSPNWAANKGHAFDGMREDFIVNLNDPHPWLTWDVVNDWRGKTCVIGGDWGIWHPYHFTYSQVDRKGRAVLVMEEQDSGVSIENAARRMAVQLTTFAKQGCKEFYFYYDVDMHRRESDAGLRIIDKFMAVLNKLPFAVVANPAVTHKQGTIQSGVSEIMTRVGARLFFVIENNCRHSTQMFQRITWEDIAKDTWGIVDCFDSNRYLVLNLSPFTPLIDAPDGEDEGDIYRDEPRWRPGVNLKRLDDDPEMMEDDPDFSGSATQNGGFRTWKWGNTRHRA